MTREAGRSKVQRRRVDGILLLDKPEGPSSNHVLQRVKRLFRAEKAGHTGTLDPFASGLLPLMFGEATKFSSFLLDASKCYEARLLLGITTTTGDLCGEEIERRTVNVSSGDIASAVATFRGEQMQVPPMFSALKRNGVPLYEFARRGETVHREPRAIVIEEIAINRVNGPEVDIFVRCSKGTYIRVLAESIGAALGCGATLKTLRRTEVASFDIGLSWTHSDIESLGAERLEEVLLPIDAGLAHLPQVCLDAESAGRLGLGQRIRFEFPQAPESLLVRLYHIESRKFLGLGSVVEEGLRPVRLVVPECANTA